MKLTITARQIYRGHTTEALVVRMQKHTNVKIPKITPQVERRKV